MKRHMKVGNREIGDDQPCFLVAEIGLNHVGDIDIAQMLMDEAKEAGFDAVKFQKRTPEVCTPKSQWNKMRETPIGYVSYIEYRNWIEFWSPEYDMIAGHALDLGIMWSVSVWDEPSVDFLMEYDPPFIKIPSACITDLALLKKIRETGKSIIMSTGMSTMTEIHEAVDTLTRGMPWDVLNYTSNVAILHCVSDYPCADEDLNLRMITSMFKKSIFNGMPIGYSSHSSHLTDGPVAVALGASVLEKHITLDRTAWGSDQANSVEPNGMRLWVKRVRRIERSMGTGIKAVTDKEKKMAEKLRKVK